MRFLATTCLLALLIAGCPQAQVFDPTDLQARITCSASRGRAPLSVVFSAAASTSTSAGPLRYAWDFGDGAASDELSPTHVFENPGRYVVRLTVTDAAGQESMDSVVVRVEGSGVVAVIAADVDFGPAPLLVHFDATQSQAFDDTIRDYYWDFGDGEQSREPKPAHEFRRGGQYTVTLRVLTAGGLEAATYATITVGNRTASLQFDGASFATLPLWAGAQQALATCTLEAWVKADSEGGTVATIGAGALSVELAPAVSLVRLRIGGSATEVGAAGLAGAWRHIAVVYEAATQPVSSHDGEPVGGTCVLYLDGIPLAEAATAGALSADRIAVGSGLRGKVGEVRFWALARSAAEIAGAKDRRVSGNESDLLGYWPLDEGTGQTLKNRTGGPDGTLGASTEVESVDPGWSQEGPPL